MSEDEIEAILRATGAEYRHMGRGVNAWCMDGDLMPMIEALLAAAAPGAPAEPAEGWVLVPKRMTQEMRDVTDSEGWTWEDLLAEAGSISQEEYAAIAAAPVAPTEWTDAKLRGIASDYFPDRAHWPAAMLCLRHLLMEQSKFGAPVAPADDNCTGCNGLGHLPDRGEYESTYLIDGQYRVRCMGCGGTGKLPNLPTLKAAPVAPAEPMKLADEFELRRLLAEERATTRQLSRALAEATNGATFMGEPVLSAKPITVEAVAEVATNEDGPYLDWFPEGGISAMEPGDVLVFAHSPITDYEGRGKVFLAPVAPAGSKPATSAPATAWWLVGTETVEFVRADYHDGDEWAPLYTAPPDVQRDAERAAINALLHQIDIGDFVDSNGHSAKMLKPVHDLLRLMAAKVPT